MGNIHSSTFSMAQGRQKKVKLTITLAEVLNAYSDGVTRTPKEWSRTKNKAAFIMGHMRGIGEGPSDDTSLTPWEERLVGLMSMESICGLDVREAEIATTGIDHASIASTIADSISIIDQMEVSPSSRQWTGSISLMDTSHVAAVEEAYLTDHEYTHREPEVQLPTPTIDM